MVTMGGDEYCDSSCTNKTAKKVRKKFVSNISSGKSSAKESSSLNCCNSMYYPMERKKFTSFPTEIVADQSSFKADNKCNNRPYKF